MRREMYVAFAFLLVGGAAGCELDATEVDDVGGNREGIPTFKQFEEQTYLEDGADGVYIVNGDEAIENVKKLREFYDMLYSDGGLIVHRSGGQDAKWNNTAKKNITYCVSNNFGNRKSTMVQAMAEATDGGWELYGDVDFIYDASQDSNCTTSNGNVVFNVGMVNNQPYLARAFFPNQARRSRSVLVDSSAFNTSWPLARVIEHELGHALGFRHEHTRPEAGQCFEDNSWRPLTPYDSASVMHYPQCGGTGPALTISPLDKEGIVALYGAPTGTNPPNPNPNPDPNPPTPPPTTGTPRTGSASGSLARGQSTSFQPLSVLAGSRLDVSITGSGDADLYVRFGSAPTLQRFDCRPYVNGSSESCALDVPAGATQAFIMVNGYTASSFTLNASWVQP